MKQLAYLFVAILLIGFAESQLYGINPAYLQLVSINPTNGAYYGFGPNYGNFTGSSAGVIDSKNYVYYSVVFDPTFSTSLLIAFNLNNGYASSLTLPFADHDVGITWDPVTQSCFLLGHITNTSGILGLYKVNPVQGTVQYITSFVDQGTRALALDYVNRWLLVLAYNYNLTLLNADTAFTYNLTSASSSYFNYVFYDSNAGLLRAVGTDYGQGNTLPTLFTISVNGTQANAKLTNTVFPVNFRFGNYYAYSAYTSTFFYSVSSYIYFNSTSVVNSIFSYSLTNQTTAVSAFPAYVSNNSSIGATSWAAY